MMMRMIEEDAEDGGDDGREGWCGVHLEARVHDIVPVQRHVVDFLRLEAKALGDTLCIAGGQLTTHSMREGCCMSHGWPFISEFGK